MNEVKTYVFGHAGTSIISRLIQHSTPQHGIEYDKLWSHVGAIVLTPSASHIFESHFKTGGVKGYTLPVDAIAIYEGGYRLRSIKARRIIGQGAKIHHYDLSFDKLKSYIGARYGLKDVKDLALGIESLNSRIDHAGVHCAEYLAKCSNFESVAKKRSDEIWPSDWQKYFLTNH